MKRVDYFVPAMGKGAEMLHGSREEIADKVIELVAAKRRAEIMARIFAYIVHRGGVADDSAAELVAAAKKIDPNASPTAILTGCGADLDAVATRSSLRLARFGKSPMRPSPIPMPNSSGKRW